MATFSRIKTWVSNEVLTASDLNGEFNNIINNMTPTGLEDYSADIAQMQSTADPGTVGTESLATSMAGEIQRLRFRLKQLAGTPQWYGTPVSTLGTGGIVTGSYADGSVTTVKLADSAVTAAKINNGEITQVKMGALGQQVSLATALFSTTSTTYVDATNLSITITTTGRPVRLELVGTSTVTGTPPAIGVTSTTTTNVTAYFKFVRVLSGTPTDLCEHGIFFNGAAAGGTVTTSTPSSALFHTDLGVIGAAGTYTYKLQMRAQSGSFALCYYSKLLAYEL